MNTANPLTSGNLLLSLKAMVPTPCAAAVQPISEAISPLPVREANAVYGCSPARRHQFAAGRQAAREALTMLGNPGAIILKADTGAPLWPAGFVGSIAHTDSVAVAVAGKICHIASIGVDIEKTGAVTDQLWPYIFNQEEVVFLSSRLSEQHQVWATTMFCLKEAFYKFQYPLTKQWLEFKDITICVANPDRSIAEISAPRLQINEQLRWSSHFHVCDKITIAVVRATT